MSNIRKLKIELIISQLKSALRSSEMESASFGIGEKGEKLTELIKEKTKVYRRSWITTPIQKAITSLEEEIVR